MLKYLFISSLFLISVFAMGQENPPKITVNPNPFACHTTITIQLKKDDTVSLKVYNRFGENMRTLITSQLLTNGKYSIYFKADTFPPGMYILTLFYGNGKTVGKHLEKTEDCGTAGLPSLKSKNGSFLLYPNPTTGVIHLPIKGGKTVFVTNEIGKIIEKKTTSKTKITLQEIPKGIYFIQVFDENHHLITIQKIRFR